jgi:hypothetical protein
VREGFSALEGESDMFGFIVGTVCLIALVKVLRRSHGWGGGCCGYGGYDRYDGWRGQGGWGGGGFGRGGMRAGMHRWVLRGLFERLHTMPGQERAILTALDRLAESRAMLFSELKETRADVARAIESGLVDDATLEETFARHDRALAQLRVSIVEALKTSTEALDERQRRELASIIARGGGWGRRDWSGPSGPYRTWA